jgi:hypothetical protein
VCHGGRSLLPCLQGYDQSHLCYRACKDTTKAIFAGVPDALVCKDTTKAIFAGVPDALVCKDTTKPSLLVFQTHDTEGQSHLCWSSLLVFHTHDTQGHRPKPSLLVFQTHDTEGHSVETITPQDIGLKISHLMEYMT